MNRCTICGREIVFGFVCQKCRTRRENAQFITFASQKRWRDIKVKERKTRQHSLREYKGV